MPAAPSALSTSGAVGSLVSRAESTMVDSDVGRFASRATSCGSCATAARATSESNATMRRADLIFSGTTMVELGSP
jgi:hypothetical protein